jgi:hypothetical protein
MYARADKVMGDVLTSEKAADKIAADMRLMRDLFLAAVGPKQDSDNPLASSHTARCDKMPMPPTKSTYSLDGAPRISSEVIELLDAVEAMKDASDLAPIVERVESMNAATLLSSAQLLGELMCMANLALSQQTVRSWKANLRADGGAVEDRSAGAVVGVPTFRSAFDGLIERGFSAERIREALLSQDIELVLTAHPTEAQRRTILKKHQRIVELLSEHDKKGILTPGELAEVQERISVPPPMSPRPSRHDLR